MATMTGKQAQERMKEGWLKAIVTFEIAGRPEKHVIESLTKYLDNIRKDDRIAILQEEREDPVKHDDGMFSTFAETEMIVKNLETFTWLCLNFSPASIEIVEPEEFSIEARDITNWLNDLLSKVHEIGSDYRTQRGAREHLTVAMNSLIKNAILLSVRAGERSAAQIGKDIGIPEDQIAPFLSHLVEKGKLVDHKGTYGMGEPERKPLPAKKKGK